MRSKPEREDAYTRAIAERDAAIAERDFILQFVEETGVVLGKGRLVRVHPTSAGVEICTLYPSQGEASAATARLHGLRGMIAFAGERVQHTVH
jgi:hypothetical protein